MVEQRFWEIDFLRGIAIILMIIFNYAFALNYLDVYAVDGGWTFWVLFPRFVASMFVLLVGLSLTLSYNKVKFKSQKEVYKKYLVRGLKIFGLGLGVTIATWLLFPEAFIVFGILHFIGISIILSIPLIRFRNLNLVLALLIIATGLYLQSFTFNFPWLLWLGFSPTNFQTFDYFPVFPWFGMTLLGIFLGNLLYRNGNRQFGIRELSYSVLIKRLSFLGRNSLVIYLLHQPVLILVLLLLGFKLF